MIKKVNATISEYKEGRRKCLQISYSLNLCLKFLLWFAGAENKHRFFQGGERVANDWYLAAIDTVVTDEIALTGRRRLGTFSTFFFGHFFWSLRYHN